MKKILFLFCLCFLFIEFSKGQITFQKTFGGTGDDVGTSGQQTTDGGYIITGYTYSYGAGNSDCYLIRTNSNGDSLWTKTFGGQGFEESNSVQQTSDGGYIITGITNSFGLGDYDVYLIKTDASGNSVWSKTFGGTNDDIGNFVQQTINGGYIITGITNSYGGGDADVYLINTDANGDTVWTKTFGGTGVEVGYCVQQTSDGGYIIAAGTTFGAGDFDVYLIKTDANGDTVWTKTFGGMVGDGVYSVQHTIEGGYVVAGRTQSFGVGDFDVYLIKTDANGDSLWTKTFGGSDYDYGYSVRQTIDGGYIVAGYTESFGASSGNVYLIKTDANGDTLWTRNFGGVNYEESQSIQQTADGGYIVAGSSYSGSNYDIYLIKTDSMGNSGCNEGGTATIVTTPATQVSSPATIVTSPLTIVTTPATIVGSGGIVTILCISVGINEITTDNLFSISPNPFTSEISITFQNLNQATISIKNILGQTVFTKELKTVNSKPETKLDLNFLEKGIYLVEVIIDGVPIAIGRTVKKIIKE